NVPPLEEELDALRTASSAAGLEGAGSFGTGRVRAQRAVSLSEQLVFERLKLQRDAFRRDLVVSLERMLTGQPPPPEFTARYDALLDAEAHAARDADLETRCDGWRRAQTEVQAEEAPPALADNKAKLLAIYGELSDLCMREEWVLDTDARLAEIARFHLARLQIGARSVWWYAWRAVVSLLIAAVLLLFSRWLARITRRLAGRSADEPDATGAIDPGAALRTRLLRLRRVLALGAYLAGVSALWLGVGILAANRIWDLHLALDGLIDWAGHPIFFIGSSKISLYSIAQIIGWTVAAVWLGRLLSRFTHDLLEHFAIQRGLRETAGTLTRYLTIVVGIAVGLSSAGVGLGGLAVVFGVLGIGIGFGLQQIASNFISGFIILLERPIRKGDFVQIGDMIGEVKAIRARATTIETRDAVTVIVPNSEFVTDRVINWTLGADERIRSQVHISVAYGSDVAKVRALLTEAARAHSGVLTWPAPDVQLAQFGDNGIHFILNFWTRRIRTLPALTSDLNGAIETAFRAEGIEIPFPQRDLHVRTAAGLTAAAKKPAPEEETP
ncbi:MAG: mechanosensitive ion channel, partial [Myxococcales bacterium]|nr:mechanosensitive ion channel [Myxococcales bacterium]